jgi:hypothetical protein
MASSHLHGGRGEEPPPAQKMLRTTFKYEVADAGEK